MEYRRYGRTGAEVSVLAMGGMRYEKPLEIERMAEIPLYLYDHGVTYFDTAPGYCDDKSEIILGTAVKEMKKRRGRRFLISTKTFAATEVEIRKQVEQSLKRLNVEAIDFYHVWCLKSWAEWEERQKAGVALAFRKLKDEGLVRHITTSVHMDAADLARLAGEGFFEGVTLGFSAANFQYREAGVQAAGAAKLGVIVMNPLGGGVYWQAPDKFAFLKSKPGDDFVRGGMRFVLSFPEVTAALVGVRSMADAEQAVAAAESLKLYSPKEFETAKTQARQGLADLCTGCNYCKECPEELPIARLMDVYNQIVLGHPEYVWGMAKYAWGLGDLDKLVACCIDCGKCEDACTQHLPIRERMKALVPLWAKAEAEFQAKEKEKK